jgi:hypothetical protein
MFLLISYLLFDYKVCIANVQSQLHQKWITVSVVSFFPAENISSFANVEHEHIDILMNWR